MLSTYPKSKLRSGILSFYLIFLAFYSALTLGAKPAIDAGGWNLHEVNYWSEANHYNNRLMGGSQWQNNWSNYPFELNAQGYPINIPAGTTPGSKITLYEPGDYVLRWQGEGSDVILSGPDISLISTDLSGTVKERVYRKNTDERTSSLCRVLIRNQVHAHTIEVWTPGLAPAVGQEGQMYKDSFLQRIEDGSSAIRFMDYGRTNGNDQVTWADRKKPDYYTQDGGVAWEHMVKLANESQKDMWICIPHLVDDQYIINLAKLIHTGMDGGVQTGEPLDPNLRVYVEWSNEVWNTAFPQYNEVKPQVEAEYGVVEGGAGWSSNLIHQYTGKRHAQAWEIFYNEFGAAAPDRVVRVLGSQIGGYTFGHQMKGVDEVPGVQADCIAIGAYFGHHFHNYVIQNLNYKAPTDTDYQLAFDHLRQSMFSTDRNNLLRSSIEAEKYGLPLVAYEGGQHIVGVGMAVEDSDLTRFLQAMNRDPRMGDALSLWLDMWDEIHGGVFMAFSETYKYSKYGSWGYREYWYETFEEAPKAKSFHQWMMRKQSSHIITYDLPKASLGHSYDFVLDVIVRNEPETLVVSSGALPHGMSLNHDGSFSGVVQDYGDFTFEVTLTDNLGNTDVRAYTLTVSPKTEPLVIYPKQDSYVAGWASSQVNGDLTFLLSGASGRETLAKWDISALAGKGIDQATVLLEREYGSSANAYFYENDASLWDESTLTWSTRPARGVLASTFSIDSAVEIQRADITSWLSGKIGQTEVGLTLVSDVNASWRSRDLFGYNGFTIEVMVSPEVFVPITYENWAIVHFGDPLLAQAQPDANPDGDGWNNDWEYALDTDPNAKDGPAYRLEKIGSQWIFSFPIHSSRHDKIVRVVGSSNLTNWDNEHYNSSTDSGLDYGWNEIQLDLTSFFTANNNQYFVRIEISNAP